MNVVAIKFEISCFCYIFYTTVSYNFFSFYLDNDKYFKYKKISKRRFSDDRLSPADSNLKMRSLLCQSLTKEKLQYPGALSRECHNQPKSHENIIKNIQRFKELDCLAFKKTFILEKCCNIKSVTENEAKFHKNWKNKISDMKQKCKAGATCS